MYLLTTLAPDLANPAGELAQHLSIQEKHTGRHWKNWWGISEENILEDLFSEGSRN